MASYFRYTPPKDTVWKTGSVIREAKEALSKVFECFNEGDEGTALKPKRVIEVEGTVPTVCKNPKELGKAKRLNLRTSNQTLTSETVELKQFDPNFLSRGNIWCKFPGCKQRRLRQYKLDGTKSQKEDLYLCPSHRNIVEGYVSKMCTEKGVSISTKSARAEDLKGYTSLIGLLESGYHLLTKPTTTPSQSCPDENTAILQEVCLNVRNYLIIVNTLLNPDDMNLATTLTTVLPLVQQIVNLSKDEEAKKTMRDFVAILKKIIQWILHFFGIHYSWVDFHQKVVLNPGAQLGAGIGGLVGAVGFIAGPVVGAATTATGSTIGGLIGGGLYNLFRPKQRDDERPLLEYEQFVQASIRAQREADQGQQAMAEGQQPTEDECVVYSVEASESGDLDLVAVSSGQLLSSASSR